MEKPAIVCWYNVTLLLVNLSLLSLTLLILTAHLLTYQSVEGSQLRTTDTHLAHSMPTSTLCTHWGWDQTASALFLLRWGTSNAGLWSAVLWETDHICPEICGGHSISVEWNHPWDACPCSLAPDLYLGHRLCHRGDPTHQSHSVLPPLLDLHPCTSISSLRGRERKWFMQIHIHAV